MRPTRKTRLPGSARLHRDLVISTLEMLAVVLRPTDGFFWQNENKPVKDSSGVWVGANVHAGAADIVGLVRGRYVELECKTGGAVLNKKQKDQRDLVRLAGGVFEIIRDPLEAQTLADKLRTKEVG